MSAFAEAWNEPYLHAWTGELYFLKDELHHRPRRRRRRPRLQHRHPAVVTHKHGEHRNFELVLNTSER